MSGEKTDAAALGFSLQVDLGAGRVGTLQTFLPNDCSLVDLNKMLDKMTAAGDRQRAHYRLEELRRELAKYEREAAQHADDLARADAQSAGRQKELETKLEKARAAVANFMLEGQKAMESKGMRGEFVPKGSDRATLSRVETGVTENETALRKELAEREQAHDNAKIYTVRVTELIERTRAEIAECASIVNAGLVESGSAA